MAIPDGKPATDFSAMNREWVRTVATEAAESGSIGLPPVTADDNGKILGVVNGAWGAMDAGGGGSSDFSTAEITLNLTVGGETITQEGLLEIYIDFPSEEEGYGSNRILAENHKVSVLMYHGIAVAFGVFAKVGEDEYAEIDGVPTTTGGVTWDTEDYRFLITGDGTITATVF